MLVCCALGITRAVISKDERELTEAQVEIRLAALLFCFFLSEEILANKMMALQFTHLYFLSSLIGLAVELLFLDLLCKKPTLKRQREVFGLLRWEHQKQSRDLLWASGNPVLLVHADLIRFPGSFHGKLIRDLVII